MCRDSNKSEWVYVIKSGSCRVLKSLKATRPDVKGLEHQPYVQVDTGNQRGLIYFIFV